MLTIVINSKHCCAWAQPQSCQSVCRLWVLLLAECKLLPGTSIYFLTYMKLQVQSWLYFSQLHSVVCCCFLLYTLRTFPRECCIVLQGLKFTEDYICSSTAEQCRGMWGFLCQSLVRWLPTHSDQSLWHAMSPIRDWSIRKIYVKPCSCLPLALQHMHVFVFKGACYSSGRQRWSVCQKEDWSFGYFLTIHTTQSVCLYLIYWGPEKTTPSSQFNFILCNKICFSQYFSLNCLWKTFWVSREKRSLRALQKEQAGNTAPRIWSCEWPSVQSRVTMWLIDENLHCLCSRPQRSRCTKGVLSWCPTSRLCRKFTSILQTGHIYCLKVMHEEVFINVSQII